MATVLSIGFEYHNRSYYTLIRVCQKDNAKEYHVTVMNGPLESLLYGCNIFTEKNGKLENEAALSPLSEEQTALRMTIGRALEHYLGSRQN